MGSVSRNHRFRPSSKPLPFAFLARSGSPFADLNGFLPKPFHPRAITGAVCPKLFHNFDPAPKKAPIYFFDQCLTVQYLLCYNDHIKGGLCGSGHPSSRFIVVRNAVPLRCGYFFFGARSRILQEPNPQGAGDWLESTDSESTPFGIPFTRVLFAPGQVTFISIYHKYLTYFVYYGMINLSDCFR